MDIACKHPPPLHRALYAQPNREHCVREVFSELGERHVRAIALHHTAGLARGLAVMNTGGPLEIPVGSKCPGRLLDVFGTDVFGVSCRARRLQRYLAQPFRVISQHTGIADTSVTLAQTLED